MFLLDTTTCQRYRVNDVSNNLPYAVAYLDPKDADKEVAFDDLQDPRFSSQTAAFSKIKHTCSIARASGLQAIWVDSVCIDRSSSAELSEALNSMFRWYQNASECYAYLSDLEPEDDGQALDLEVRLRQCKWFKRPWVLQELIGSKNLHFFDSKWNQIGTKLSLLTILSSITRIDQPVLEDAARLSDFSIGRRMSWASNLLPVRPEDAAYSLLGIFQVNVSIVYGERDRAFRRLQEEILKDTEDATLFGWKATNSHQNFRGLLADSPADFSHFAAQTESGPVRIRGHVRPTSAGIVIDQIFGYVEGLPCTVVLSTEPCTADGTSTGFSILLREWNGRFVRCVPHILLPPTFDKLCRSTAMSLCVLRSVTAKVSERIIQAPMPAQAGKLDFLGPSLPLPSRKRDAEGNLSNAERQGRYVFKRDIGSGEIDVGVLIGEKYISLGKLVPMARQQVCKSEQRYDTMSRMEHSANGGGAPSSEAESEYNSESSEDIEDIEDIEDVEDVEDIVDVSSSRLAQKLKLDPSHQFAEHLSELVEAGLNRFMEWALQNRQQWISSGGQPKNQDSDPSPRSVKRLKSDSIAKYINVEDKTDSEDEDAVFVQTSIPNDIYSNKEERHYYACPFYLRNRSRHRNCLSSASLRDIDDVAGHIWAAHRRPNYCPICKEIFGSQTACDAHIRARVCKSNQKPVCEGVTEHQMALLSRDKNANLSPVEKWHRMWATLFREEKPPASPYLSGDLEYAACLVRDYWEWEGPKSVREFLVSKGFSADELNEEERNMAALGAASLEQIIIGVITICEHKEICAENHEEASRLLAVLGETPR